MQDAVTDIELNPRKGKV